ncbi:hypothetical protein BASA61_010016 [Batrachochytrium salamandrivorans]|nr:hypothetical protein BASA61_010016 [Batrachochytrium salamandrivorans]KAH6584098.1 hypothetical protein BASA60_001103 [Batrachochytrium salamandrivorans]
MRVHIGIVLSVLSFSALAEVIPNDDSLLVRRTVSSGTTGLLWKRANGDDEKGSSPPNSEIDAGAEASGSAGAEASGSAGAEASDSDGDEAGPSGSSSSAFSKVNQDSDFTEGPHRPSQEQLLSQRTKHILQSDKRSIQAVVRKIAGVIEDENKNEFLFEIKDLLTQVLGSARMSLEPYKSKLNVPFVLIIPEGTTNQQSLAEKMVNIKGNARGDAKLHLDNVKSGISRIIANPRNVMKEINRIMRSVKDTYNLIKVSCNIDYKIVFLEVENPENEAHVKVTEAYVHQMEGDRDLALSLFEKIKDMVDYVTIKPKETISSISLSLRSNVKRRLRIKGGSSFEKLL